MADGEPLIGRMLIIWLILAGLLVMLAFSSCQDESNTPSSTIPPYIIGLYKDADWYTENTTTGVNWGVNNLTAMVTEVDYQTISIELSDTLPVATIQVICKDTILTVPKQTLNGQSIIGTGFFNPSGNRIVLDFRSGVLQNYINIKRL
jgi:hypothetical protein